VQRFVILVTSLLNPWRARLRHPSTPALAGKEILEYLLAGNRAAIYNRGIYLTRGVYACVRAYVCVCVCVFQTSRASFARVADNKSG